jgi:tetratricopeptide (TPR) repeat protein
VTRGARASAAFLAAALAAVGAANAEDPTALVSRRAQAYNLFSRAQMLLLHQQDAAAADLLDRAVERDPSPDLLLEAARAQTTTGRFDRAAQYIDRVLKARPGWAPALAQKGDLHLALARTGVDVQGNVEAALEAYRQAAIADPSDVETTRALAELCAQTGRMDEAIGHLARLEEAESLPPNLELLLARLYLRAGRAADAGPLLEAAVRRAPTGQEAVDMLAALYESQDRFDDAVALYAPLLDGGAPVRAGVRARVALLHLEAHRPRQAAALLQEAIALEPGSPDLYLLLLQADDQAGDLDAALDACDHLLRLEPDRIEARFHHARLLRQRGDAAAARAEYDELVRRAARNDDLDQRDEMIVTLAWGQAGLLAFSARDWHAAAERLGTAIARSTEPSADLLSLHARALIESGDLEGAATAVTRAIASFPDDLDVRMLACDLATLRADRTEADACPRALIDGASGSVDSYLAVSHSFMRRRLFSDAESTLREAIDRHPGDERLLFERGAALERAGRRSEAERLLASVIESNPGNAMALNYLGYMLAESGRRLHDSLSYVERALALDPENPAYLDSLGWALFKLERYAPAEEKMRAALRYDGTDPVLREHLGDLLDATGRPEEAVREWEAALECGHEEPDRIRAKVQRVRAQDTTAR